VLTVETHALQCVPMHVNCMHDSVLLLLFVYVNCMHDSVLLLLFVYKHRSAHSCMHSCICTSLCAHVYAVCTHACSYMHEQCFYYSSSVPVCTQLSGPCGWPVLGSITTTGLSAGSFALRVSLYLASKQSLPMQISFNCYEKNVS
jgi:hypothetical protein